MFSFEQLNTAENFSMKQKQSLYKNKESTKKPFMISLFQIIQIQSHKQYEDDYK